MQINTELCAFKYISFSVKTKNCMNYIRIPPDRLKQKNGVLYVSILLKKSLCFCSIDALFVRVAILILISITNAPQILYSIVNFELLLLKMDCKSIDGFRDPVYANTAGSVKITKGCIYM